VSTSRLEHVNPTQEPGLIARSYAALAATRVAKFISRHINWRLDPLLLRATRGRPIVQLTPREER
jgi:hypothetical protein